MTTRHATWIAAFIGVCTALAAPVVAWGHGAASKNFRTTILEVEPSGLPVDVRMVDGDKIRFENTGDEELVLCGYDADECEEWVRIGPDGVFEDRNSEAYYANADGNQQGKIPDGAGEKTDFERVRREPAFYTYHDHRVHWMGEGNTLPPNVDENDPSPQKVFDGTVEFRYGETTGSVSTRLDYVGGRSAFDRYGEYVIVGAGVLAMLVVFGIDARRRRRRRAAAVTDAPA